MHLLAEIHYDCINLFESLDIIDLSYDARS